MVVPPPSPPSETFALCPCPVPVPDKNVSLNPAPAEKHTPDASLLCCPFNIVYIQPDADGPASCGFARGRFSRVSRAAPAPPSPPQSPISPTTTTIATRAALPAPGTLLAVKRPATGTNVETMSIQAEAAVLSYISAITDAQERNEHVVKFYGFVPEQNAIVMDLLDRTLEEYILAQKACCAAASTTEPVIGIEAWLHLAASLIKGLEWLHEKAGVVHGDIKPANIMLTAKTHHTSPLPPSDTQDHDPFPYRAIYTDFGSAHIPSPLPLPSSKTHLLTTTPSFSVGTPAFTAPELLSLRNPAQHPTKPADVFSLAATLITAITGDTRLYEASSIVAMYHLAQNGDLVLENVRNAYPMRLLPGSAPVRLLKGAVGRVPEKRWRAGEWGTLVEGEIRRRCE